MHESYFTAREDGDLPQNLSSKTEGGNIKHLIYPAVTLRSVVLHMH
jgi:hypothetical protein